jgi:hypothetical protein
MRELRLARGPAAAEGVAETDTQRPIDRLATRPHLSACEHRTVSREGRIVCQKIVEGDREVSPNVCRDCPYKKVNCTHLRFSLRLSSPSPLLVRYNGRTEVWDDGPPQLAFARAACAERVVPIHGPRACSDCPLRQPLRDAAVQYPPAQSAAAMGRVVSFPAREAAAAVG